MALTLHDRLVNFFHLVAPYLHEDLTAVVASESSVFNFELHRAKFLAVVDQTGKSELVEFWSVSY